MNTLCYLFVYAFEQFISYIFFSNKFETKRKPIVVFTFYLISFIIQFSVHLLPVSELNLLAFFICNAFVSYFCYRISLKQLIFNVLLLEGFMITTELLSMFLMSIILGVKLIEYTVNDNVLFLETAVTKISYFIVAYFFSKISIKETKSKQIQDFSLVLFILPLASIIIIVSLVYLSITTNPDNIAYILFAIISSILLLSNVIVFYIHQKVIATLTQNAEYQIIQQRSEINKEHYTELERQYDISSILIHDIKRHLQTINNFAQEQQADKIINYIDSIYSNMEIKTINQFSDNKLINVIINRYSGLCFKHEIKLYSDVRNVEFDFIDDFDLVSLLDNLLENAFEAAKQSEERFIDIRINDFNESFIVFNIKNSTSLPPYKQNGKFYTSKSNSSGHGVGIKSIERVAKKYDGHVDFEYDNTTKTFNAKIILNANLSLIS